MNVKCKYIVCMSQRTVNIEYRNAAKFKTTFRQYLTLRSKVKVKVRLLFVIQNLIRNLH